MDWALPGRLQNGLQPSKAVVQAAAIIPEPAHGVPVDTQPDPALVGPPQFRVAQHVHKSAAATAAAAILGSIGSSRRCRGLEIGNASRPTLIQIAPTPRQRRVASRPTSRLCRPTEPAGFARGRGGCLAAVVQETRSPSGVAHVLPSVSVQVVTRYIKPGAMRVASASYRAETPRHCSSSTSDRPLATTRPILPALDCGRW